MLVDIIVIMIIILTPRAACVSGIWGFTVLEKRPFLFPCFLPPQTDTCLFLVVESKRKDMRSGGCSPLKWIEMTFQLPCPYSWKRTPQSGCWTTYTHLREASGADKNCRGKQEPPLASQMEELWPPYLASPTHLCDLEQSPLTKNQFLGEQVTSCVDSNQNSPSL